MKVKKTLKICAILCLSVAIILLSSILIFVSNCIDEVRNIDVNLCAKSITNCSIYDSQKNQISNNLNIVDSYVTLDEIPQYTKDAFLSIEDKDFYKHKGVNLKRMLSALVQNIATLSFSQGASTITQQLVKNKYLNNEKTLSRKVKEIYLSKKIESIESKDRILEEYLNTIYYGSGAYGIGNASYRYFGKNVRELTLDESCILAGVINLPSKYSPIASIENSKGRRDVVLKSMFEDGKITKEEYKNNTSKDIILNVQKIDNVSDLSLYSQNVINEASKILNMEKNEILHKGYKIYTYQDPKVQNVLDEIIKDNKYYPKNDYGNTADSLAIVLDNNSGGVIATSGKSEYTLINIKRQPGSLIKPIIVYAPALEEKIIYPCSQLLDERIAIDGYSPKNVGDKYYGYVSVDDCLAKSLNTPTVKLCDTLGIDLCKKYGSKAGLNFSEYDNGLAISLGGLKNGFTIQNITESYLPFSNNGNAKKSKYISKIVSPNKKVVYIDKMAEKKYCSAQTSYFMTKSLEYAVKNGTSKKLSNLPYDIAGKTGTVNVKDSNLNTDCYSLAYTSKNTMCVWLGNYSMKKEYNLNGDNNGGTYATQIVRDTFENIYQNTYPEDFMKCDGIVEFPIDTIALSQRHEVVIAHDLPTCYQKVEEFSINNLPNISNYNYCSDDIIFNLVDCNNYVNIELYPEYYNSYYIYRRDALGNEKLVGEISDCDKKYIFSDKKISFNQDYTYYIVCKGINGKKILSKEKIIKIKKDYNKVIGEQDDMYWIFT